MAVLTPCPLIRIRPCLPLPIGFLDPGTVRALLIMTSGTKLRTSDKVRIFNAMKGRSPITSRTKLYFARLYDEAKIKGFSFR